MFKRTAIVTGGSRGIGQAITDRLHNDSWNVVACGRGARPSHLPQTVIWVEADVANTKKAEAIVATAMDAFGTVNALVNNAGLCIEKTIVDSTDSDWELIVGTNCKGVFNMCRAILPEMQQNGGSIVNIGSISGVLSDPSMALYNATKAFVHGLTRSIAVDHGPKVRCNAIRPGWIETEMAEDGFALADNPLRARKDALSRHALRRFGDPVDISNLVAWLLSDQASFVTGECITADGGLTASSPLRPALF